MKDYLTGARGVEEALKRGRGVLLLAKKEGRGGQLLALAERQKRPVRRVAMKDLDHLCGREKHRGFALEIAGETGNTSSPGNLKKLLDQEGDKSLVILLDGITDPRNLGAVMRAADQFAAAAVIIPRRRSAGRGDEVSRASAGAVEWVPLVEAANITRALETLRQAGYWCWGADARGTGAAAVDLSGRTALVMGREGEGLHRLVRDSCDGLIRIPTGGRLDSLNVATAAGILMYEARRQQDFPY